MTFRERMRWFFRMALLLFVLASVAFLSALMAMRFAIQGREFTMPNVVGMPAAQARQILQGRGVGMKVEDRIYSRDPVDTVVRQSPVPNMRVKIGQDVRVLLSLGPQQANIPELENQSVRVAQVELLRDGMQLGEVSSLYLPASMPDTVVQQDPAPGTTDATSPHVDLLVTLGSRPPAYVMPGFYGTNLAEAESKLAAAGLKLPKITLAEVPGAAHGDIVGQTPGRGERVDDSTVIELQVAE